MKISLDWIGDFVTFTETDPQVIAAEITARVAEVDTVEEIGGLLNNCCIGKVVSLQKHPNADKLSLCEVQTDRGVKQVVCGGTNLRQGMRIAFAHVGATVRHGAELFTLQNAKIRGEDSEGMICAAEELELEDRFPPQPEDGDRPIIDLGDGDDGVGTPLADYLGLGDTVIHIDNHAITHRADLFSHIGFALECVAIGIAEWKEKPKTPKVSFPKTKVPFAFHVQEPHLMPRYCACMIEADGLGATPDWMKKRLAAVGWRPVNLPVDITNYVASEVGVPLHSFDADDLQGDVHMRVSTKGETIVTLDEKTRELPDGALVLSDDAGIFDLLGIMGGLRSSTKDSTRRFYLHSASLDPASIRRTVTATGHRTDAATVYEKGVPHITTEHGFFRAAQLFAELLPNARIASRMESVGDNGTAKPITLSVARTQSLLGADIPGKEMQTMLERLECTVQAKGNALTVTPPLHRLKDLTGPHDLAEEVGRIYGYNTIEAKMPVADVRLPSRDFRVHRLRDALKDSTFFEILPLSFVGPDLLRACRMDPSIAPVVGNPLGLEYSLMTPGTVPALLEHAGRNLRFCDTVLSTFHISRVFQGSADLRTELGMLVCAKDDTSLMDDPFLQISQALAHALGAVGYDLSIAPASDAPAYAHPGRVAELRCGKTVVGSICEIHPAVRLAFDLPARASAAVVDLAALLAIPVDTLIARSVPEYPAVSYDLTLKMDHRKSAGTLLAKMEQTSPLLESVEIVDLYSGTSPEEGQYRVTIRCTYRAADRTLTDEEAKGEFAKVEAMAG